MRAFAVAAALALFGALLMGTAGMGFGDWFADRYMPDAELEGVAPLGAGLVTGVVGGAALGCFLGLRLTGRRVHAAVAAPALTLGGLAIVLSWLFVAVNL